MDILILLRAAYELVRFTRTQGNKGEQLDKIEAILLRRITEWHEATTKNVPQSP